MTLARVASNVSDALEFRSRSSTVCVRMKTSSEGSAPPRNRFWTHALLVLVAVLHASAVPIDFIDDAYISFRYAWHLSHGNGLVFNVGTPVEGYSNLSWVLIAAAVLKLGIPLEAGMRCAALVFLAATPVVIQALLLRIGASLTFATSAGLLLAFNTAWIIPSLNGLEGALFSFLLTTITWLNWRNSSSSTSARVAILSGIVGVLLSATRPEGPALYLIQLGAGAALSWRIKTRPTLRPHWIALATFLAGFAALTIWRFVTYGSLIPTPVLAKMGSPSHPFARVVLSPAGHGFLYCVGFIKATLPLWILLGIGTLYVLRHERPVAAAERLALPSLAFALLMPAFVVVLANNGDWMPDFRLLAPYAPLLVLSAAGLVVGIASRPATIALSIAALLSAAPHRLESPTLSPLLTSERSDYYRKMCRLGADVSAAATGHRAPVVAIEIIGVFSYCAPLLPLRDLNGLTDREIALNEPSSGPFGRKTSAATLEAMRPDVIIYSDLNYLRILLAESPWFAREYVTLSCDRLFGDPLYIYFFVRRDSSLAAPGALAMCPAGRISPAEAFAKANCNLKEWPYAFPRNCPVV